MHDFGKIRNGKDYNSRHQGLFPAAKQVIGPRTSRSSLEHLDDENSDVVDTDEIESWASQGHLKTRASVERVSELDDCQIGMTASIIADVNAVYTLECAHLRQLLAARALNERSL